MLQEKLQEKSRYADIPELWQERSEIRLMFPDLFRLIAERDVSSADLSVGFGEGRLRGRTAAELGGDAVRFLLRAAGG